MNPKLTSITAPVGFTAGGTTCQIKQSSSPDLALIVSEVPANCAAVFTRNSVTGAPVTIGKKHTRNGTLRAIVCNSGIANVATGQKGIDNALAMCRATAKAVGCKITEVLPASTGVIGHQLPITKITKGITALAKQLTNGTEADAAAAQAILTTDTRPKAALRAAKIGKTITTLGGIAKGSGMISPNMATMLSFITTDCNITAPLLQTALNEAVNADGSFNRLSVDSDTSTSDTVAVLANGLADNKPITTKGVAYRKFAATLADLCCDLAYQVISDGEGVNHVIRVVVSGAKNNDEAVTIARSVADSPLIKTAVHGHDPNWGRLAMAVGKSGAKLNLQNMTFRIGNTIVYRNAGPVRFNAAKVSKAMQSFEVELGIDVSVGKGSCVFLGCDLSRDYIIINADYHT